MNLSETDSEAIDPSESPSVYFCPTKPIYTWILTETAAFYVSITTRSIASPLTVLLNVLIIVAVKKRRALQTNSSILLTSMAFSDLLVGAVSMPLTTALDILFLFLHKKLRLTICKIAGANQIVLYSAVSSSLYHLTFIAWERYVAIKNWRSYKTVISKTRLKICAVVAWVLAAISAFLVPILWVAEVDQKVMAALSIFSATKTVLCVAVIGFFYISIYLCIRKRKENEINQVSGRTNTRLENAVAKATGTVTAALLVSYVPSIIALFLGDAVPFLRTSSYFRWSELLIQMNSLFNPIVYCFAVNRAFRNEVLEMINSNSLPQLASYPNPLAERHIRQRDAPAVILEEVNECQEEKQQPDRHSKSRSCDSNELPYPDQIPGAVNSSPSSKAEELRVIVVDKHRPNPDQRKQRLLHFGHFAVASKKENLSQAEEKNDKESFTYTPQQITERLSKPSHEEEQGIVTDRNPSKAMASGTAKEKQGQFDENDDQNFPNNEPAKLKSRILTCGEIRSISVHEDQAELREQKPNIRYSASSTEENQGGKTEDSENCCEGFLPN